MKISVKMVLTSLVLAVASMATFAAVGSPQVSAASCVDGKERGDFKGEWLSKDTVNVKTREGGKLCSDVTIYVSSYTMPAHYNGGDFFGNTTAYPQQKFATKAVALAGGTDGNTTVTIAVPDACTNFQTDAYIGPEVVTVGADGHMGRTIKAQITKKTQTNCAPEMVKTCNTQTKTIVDVEKGKENTAPYSTDLSKCKMVEVCDTTTGKLVTITESEAKDSKYAPANSVKCEDQLLVCDPATKTYISLPKSEASKYTDKTACEPKVEKPEVLPSTGPMSAILSVLPFSAIAGATTLYIRSRR